MWVTDENNRRIIGMLGENNRGNFQELQNRIIGKIKSILGSGLYTNQVHRDAPTRDIIIQLVGVSQSRYE